MSSSARRELDSIQEELKSIIRELKDISNSIQKDFSGISNITCADRITDVASHCSSMLSILYLAEVIEDSPFKDL